MKTYDGDLTGLTQEEVQERRKKYGYNELNEKEESLLHRLLGVFGDQFHG